MVGVFSLILLLVGGMGLKNSSDTLEGLRTVYEDRTVALGQILLIDQRLRSNTSAFYAGLLKDPANPIAPSMPGSLEDSVKSLRDSQSLIGHEWKKYMATYLTPEEKTIAQRVDQLLVVYGKEVTGPVIDYFSGKHLQIEQSAQFIKLAGKIGGELREQVQQLIELQERVAKEEYEQALTNYRRTRSLLIGLVVTGLLLAGLVSWNLIRSVTVPLGKIRDAVEHVRRSGDFTVSLPVARGAEVGQTTQAFNELLASLRATLQTMLVSIGRVGDAAGELADNAQQAASAASDTSESTSAMAAAIEQVTVSINHVGDATRHAMEQARAAGMHANQGGDVIHRAVGEINQIAETVRQVSGTIVQLGERSERISGVIQVIKDVADQTNLLALNAAIEAARAGESGRGFAVVADEVRKLAERTAGATGEIGQMIAEIQHSSRDAVSSMEAAVHQVDAGVRLAGEAGGAITRIGDSTRQVVETITSISDSILEQGAASNTIAGQVERVAQATEENSAIAQNSAESAQYVENQAREMREAAARFRI